ncbi:unnamed protein product [Gordionus sp. m RMFG-2023]
MAQATSFATDNFDSFYKEVKKIEEIDSVLTSKAQIDRLLRPGSTYFNLNPFAVLDIDPQISVEEIKKKFRKLSMLLHPDKNRDDLERAQKAFDALTKAWKLLEDEKNRKNCYEVVEQAKLKIEDKKKQLAREGKPIIVEETQPDKFKHALYIHTTKIFADLERKRQQLETRDMEERKRQRELELSEEEKKQFDIEWNKNFEDTREIRIDSWLKFKRKLGDHLDDESNPNTSSSSASAKKINSPKSTTSNDNIMMGNCYTVFANSGINNEKKKKKVIKTFKPPKHKAEQRN